MNDRLRRGFVSTAAVAGLSCAGFIAAASGHETGGPTLVRERDANEIEQRAFEDGPAEPGSYRVAQLFGESDQERAARLQLEQSQNASINYTRQKLQDMESTARRLTGQVEEQDHEIAELKSRIDRMQRDFEYRLCTMAQQQLNAAGGGESQGSFLCGNAAALPGSAATLPPPPPSNAQTYVSPATAPSQPPPGRVSATFPPPSSGTGSLSSTASAASSPPAPPRRSGEPMHLAPPPGNLGTMPANAAPANAIATSPGPSANRSKFDSAMRLLAKTQYDEARSSFRTFADNYPQDELAPQAVYWIGDIALVQKDYPGAARAFAEEIKKYPDSARAPDSMLKLGESLIAMGQKQEGCTALAALPTKYPSASKTVVNRAAQEQKASACR